MMIRLLLIFLIIDDAISMRGGVSKKVEKYKFIVSIWYYHEHRCSGAIIDDTHVLTTGHCVYAISPCILSVAAGIVQWEQRKLQLIRVKEYYIHPEFEAIRNPWTPNVSRWKNDIAVLELEENIIWSSIVGPARLLISEFHWYMCSSCKLLGWNHEIIDDRRLLTLRWAQAVTIPNEECENLGINLLKNEKCVDNIFTQSVMNDGDQGSLLICDKNAVGIYIDGGEIENKPATLLTIYPYLDFIAEIVQAGPINVPLNNFQSFVSLWYYGNYHCGGTIIDDTHIITAGHCVNGTELTKLRIIAGYDKICSDLKIKWLQVKKIQIHPKFTNVYYEHEVMGTRHDIAILTLEESLVWSTNLKPALLAETLHDDQLHEIYRWIFQLTPHECLKSVSSYGWLMPSPNYSILTEDNQYCIKGLHSLPLAVRGDSGSPIMSNGRLVGVLHGGYSKWYENMGSTGPIIFTSIIPYLDWIKTTVADKNSYVLLDIL